MAERVERTFGDEESIEEQYFVVQDRVRKRIHEEEEGCNSPESHYRDIQENLRERLDKMDSDSESHRDVRSESDEITDSTVETNDSLQIKSVEDIQLESQQSEAISLEQTEIDQVDRFEIGKETHIPEIDTDEKHDDKTTLETDTRGIASESVEEREIKIGKTGKTDVSECKESSEEIRLLDSRTEYDTALEHNPEQRLRKGFARKHHESIAYYELKEELEIGDVDLPKFAEEHDIPLSKVSEWVIDDARTDFIETLCELEMRRLYEEIHDGPPEVKIESMDDVDQYLVRYSQEREAKDFSTRYRDSRLYFEVKDDRSMLQRELAKIHEVSQQRISDHQSGKEPTLVSNLRQHEEERIIREWADTKLKDQLRIERATKNPEASVALVSDDIGEVREHQSNSIQRIEAIKVRKVLSELDLETCTMEDIASGLKEICHELSETKAKIAYTELSTPDLNNEQLSGLLKIMQENRVAIESKLREQLGLDVSDKSVRFGIVESRAYVWNPDLTPDDMINAWSKQYFYFNTKDLARFVIKVGEEIQLDKNDYENLQHLNELIRQMISDKASGQIRVKDESSRILGEVLHLQCDILGLSPMEIEGMLKKVAGKNGQGGILSPKLLRGEELEGLRADLIATTLSDCTLRENGRIEYYEGDFDRIQIVLVNLSTFGDFDVTIRYIPHKHLYGITFPRPFGKALLFWEVSHGDKTIKNPYIPSIIENGSLKGKAEYMGGLIPEEGHVGRDVSWSRSNAVHAGNKAELYHFQPRITKEEIDLIISEGRSSPNDLEGKIYLSMSKIKELKKSEDTNIVRIAQKISRTIKQNPNHLITGEGKIAQDMGVKVGVDPVTISYYEKTGRVSVKWLAKTRTIKDTVRWGILFPPNDIRKMETMWEIIAKRPNLVKSIIEDLKNEGIQFEEWWTD